MTSIVRPPAALHVIKWLDTVTCTIDVYSCFPATGAKQVVACAKEGFHFLYCIECMCKLVGGIIFVEVLLCNVHRSVSTHPTQHGSCSLLRSSIKAILRVNNGLVTQACHFGWKDMVHACVHAELGGPLCSASELKRLIALLRSFPTTAAWDHLMLKVAPCPRFPLAPFLSCQSGAPTKWCDCV